MNQVLNFVCPPKRSNSAQSFVSRIGWQLVGIPKGYWARQEINKSEFARFKDRIGDDYVFCFEHFRVNLEHLKQFFFSQIFVWLYFHERL